jgi:pyruvate kinase
MPEARYHHRRTKIVCTLGPSTAEPHVLQNLIQAGMDIARLNLSHADFSVHAKYIESVRDISWRLGIDVAIMIDLPGPKHRIGSLKGGQVVLKKGAPVSLTGADIQGNSSLIPVTLPRLAADIRRGNTVLLDDGAMELSVLSIDGEEVHCRVIAGGVLEQGKGLVVPGMRISIPFLTPELRKSIIFAAGQKPDYLALSFVTEAKDIKDVRTILKQNGADIPIIAKIESGEAVKNFSDILAACDGAMVARGDLGVELPLERVPLIQKDIIRRCNRAGKPVITATEMLESMITNFRPTRAETTDVANAILDGTDAVMLSAETSIGKYPVQAVKMMASIARVTEKMLDYEQILSQRRSWLERETDELISYNACQTARHLRAAAIVAYTQSGSTAMRVSRCRPDVPVLALTPHQSVACRLLLYWGVRPHLTTVPSSLDDVFSLASRLAKKLGYAKTGELIVITAGVPLGETGTTNMLKVEKVS